MINTDLNI